MQLAAVARVLGLGDGDSLLAPLAVAVSKTARLAIHKGRSNMGHRTVRRVPMDFSWPLHKVWDGYICHLGGPCPGAGKTCFNGSTAGGKWLERICSLIAMIGDEAACAPHAEELKARGRLYPHPYLEEWSQAPRTEMPDDVAAELREIEPQGRRMQAFADWRRRNPAKLLPLTSDLVELAKGLGVREPVGIGSDYYYVYKKLVEAAGLTENWGTCPVCEGNADDPAKRAEVEAWKETSPPSGEGWQLWETCSEGSPVSPVFETATALAEWCADNATTFASFKATKEQWLRMFSTEDGADVGSMGMMMDGKFGAAIDFGIPEK